VPKLRCVVKCLRAAIYWPSGLQVGAFNRRKVSRVIARAPEPSAFITQILSAPPRSEVKAISRPSGEKRGCMSKASPDVIRVGRPPAIGMV